MKTKIHVNQHRIRSNKKRTVKDREPVLTVKNYKSNTYATEVEIKGPCKVVYRPDNPLSCGAVCWIETESEVICYPLLPTAQAKECNPSDTQFVDCYDQLWEYDEPDLGKGKHCSANQNHSAHSLDEL